MLLLQSKELETLSREHERVLNELKLIKQSESNNRSKSNNLDHPKASQQVLMSISRGPDEQPSQINTSSGQVFGKSGFPNSVSSSSLVSHEQASSNAVSVDAVARPVSPRPTVSVPLQLSHPPPQLLQAPLKPSTTSVIPELSFTATSGILFEQLLASIVQVRPNPFGFEIAIQYN